MKKILFCTIFIMIGVFLLFGETTKAASNIDSKISETKGTVQKLLEVKDDTSLSQEDRGKLEFQLKKSIIADILDISGTQLKNAREQLEKIPFPQSKDWEDVKDFVFASLDAYDAYYKETKNSLQSNDLTTEKLQGIAKGIEDKKTSEIDIFLQKMTSISTTFGINDILKRADERLEKVESDVNKVYTQKLTQKNDLKESFQKAAAAVGEARTLNNKAKEIILNVYTQTTNPTSTIDEETLPNDFMISFEKDVRLFLEESTTTPANASSTSPLTDKQKEEYLQDIIKRSAEKVRDAYTIFIQMSLDVKEYIKE